MKVTKLVIDRETWGMKVLLSATDKKMCCLGFLAIACGAVPDEIQEECEPQDVPNVDWPAAFVQLRRRPFGNSALATSMMKVNDHGSWSWATKERRLITLFKKAGIKLSFKRAL